MSKIPILIFATFLAVTIFGVGHDVFAQSNPATLNTNPTNLQSDTAGEVGSNNPTNSKFQLVSCQGIDDPRTPNIVEKECDYQQLIATVSRLIQFALYILIPIVLGMIIYIGFKFLTSNGDSGKLADAKRMITPLLIGIFLIFSAWLIVYTFLDKLLVSDLKSGVVPTSLRSK